MKRLLALLIITAFVLSAQAQDNKKTINIKAPRPKVGVVLGGGGAKGAAHIGVLKYLEEVGIPIDYVAGTSMGSIIGGLYAMGYSPDELAQLIADMDWGQYVGNSLDRSAMSEEVRQRNSTLLVNIPFSFKGLLGKKDNNLVSFMPSAYVNNTSLINLFNNLCVGYQKEMDFNDLPIPFACVATDIRTGDEIDIRHGSVPTAMRASMAIPGVFAPVRMDGHLLVDGGLVNNFPADVLKEMGADIIIGVDVSDRDSISPESGVSVLEVLNGLVDNAVSSKKTDNQKLCDIYLAPDITGYGTLSFTHDAIDTLVNRGYQKAKEYDEPLKKIKRHVEAVNGKALEKRLHATKAKNLANEPLYISSIILNQSGDPMQTEWLYRKGKLSVEKHISEKEINRAVDVYRGTGAFDNITYNLTENENDTIDSYTLTMDFKPTQPHTIGIGVRYDSEEGAAMLFNIGLNAKRLTGYKLNIVGRLSYNPRINITGTYSSLNLANFNFRYEYRNQHYKTLDFDNNYTNLSFVQNTVGLYVSQFHLLDFSSDLGVAYTFASFDQDGLLHYTNDSVNQAIAGSVHYQTNHLLSPYIKMSYDNLNDAYFATRGIKAMLSGHVNFDLKGAANTTQDIGIAIQGYITPRNGRFTLVPQLYGRCVFGSPLYANLWNIAGGYVAQRHTDFQMPFVGMADVINLPDLATVARLDLRYNFYGKHYLTATYNYLFGAYPFGASHEYADNVSFSGIGLCYSYNSLIGPISLLAQWSDCTKRLSGYLSIGYQF